MSDIIITSQELQQLMQTPHPDFILLDVRSDEERLSKHIGGLHIPLHELPERMKELDKNKLIITYCRSGVRSLSAVKILVAAGFDSVKSLSGGILEWFTLQQK